jgi:NTP pyrophosphatase (non-canonical NTP hydrolase)
MEFKEYQEKAKETAVYPKTEPSWIYPLLGLAGESGEIFEKLKKVIRDDGSKISEEKINLLKKEIGDVLWYLSTLSTELGLSLNEVAEENIEKLFSRKERNKLHGNGDLR